MNAENIRIESEDRGFELHIDTTEDGTLIFNIHMVAGQLYDAVKGMIGPWIAEGEAARREYETGVADDPTQQVVLDRIRGGNLTDDDFYNVRVDHLTAWETEERRLRGVNSR